MLKHCVHTLPINHLMNQNSKWSGFNLNSFRLNLWKKKQLLSLVFRFIACQMSIAHCPAFFYFIYWPIEFNSKRKYNIILYIRDHYSKKRVICRRWTLWTLYVLCITFDYWAIHFYSKQKNLIIFSPQWIFSHNYTRKFSFLQKLINKH